MSSVGGMMAVTSRVKGFDRKCEDEQAADEADGVWLTVGDVVSILVRES